jgi:tetratricopeptide (TPR) repeat protein
MSACTDTTNANERVRCADAAIASGEGLSSADDAVSQLPYWMTFPRRVAGDARVAGAPVAARPEPAEQAARHPTASERPQNSHLEAGRALASADDMQGAIREFGEAIRLEPQLAAAYFERGQVLFKNGNSEGAIADFETATRIDPQQAMAFKALGMAVHYRGDSDRAIANLTRAIQIAQADPLRMSAIDLFFARRTRASLYNRMRHFDGELSNLGAMIDAYWKNPALASALRANYGEAGAAGVMAQVYRSRTANLVARRNFDAATADLSMAMHLDPRQTLALTIERGRVQEMAGRSAQAEADFKRALELSPNNDDVKSALSRLRSKS